AAGRPTQRFTEQLAHPSAVGKPGKDVDIGEVSQPLLRLPNFGDVGADSAKALETAGGIDDRVAGHRDPARSARRLHLHLERIEWLLLKQHAAELGMAAEQRRKRMAEQ